MKKDQIKKKLIEEKKLQKLQSLGKKSLYCLTKLTKRTIIFALYHQIFWDIVILKSQWVISRNLEE